MVYHLRFHQATRGMANIQMVLYMQWDIPVFLGTDILQTLHEPVFTGGKHILVSQWAASSHKLLTSCFKEVAVSMCCLKFHVLM